MAGAQIAPATAAAPDGSSLGLLRIPFTFSQDPLLKTGGFVDAAAKRGLGLSLRGLQELCELGLLLPLFRIDDEQIVGRQVSCGRGAPWDLAIYASRGQVRDPADEGTRWWPYERPLEAPRDWWDGYYFSPWQLLDVERALISQQYLQHGDTLGHLRQQAQEGRKRTLALCALASRHHPLIWGQASSSSGSFDEFHDAQHGIPDAPRLDVARFPLVDLQSYAEQLLGHARSIDPMIDLWPLMRHANYLAWKRFTGQALLALEHRIAAELLLRAHEHLAEQGQLEPLPELSNLGWHRTLQDRITVRNQSADSLERALGAFGLSPYPRVLLLVEGPSERIHITRLLEELGLGRPNEIRVHVAGGSATSPRMLASYVVSPRLGPELGDRRLIEGTPTALFVVMDPENKWTPEKLDKERRSLRAAVRDEVARQGGRLGENELDVLVHVSTWGDQKYELANFTFDQLASAMYRLALEQGHSIEDEQKWRAVAVGHLQTAWRQRKDIKYVFQRLQVREAKPRLAELLIPDLLEALHRGRDGSPESLLEPPVLRMLQHVIDTHAQLMGSGYSVASEPSAGE